jgi:multiple antibiotic resistance protein
MVMESIDIVGYFIYTFVSIFVIVNPVEATIVYIALTSGTGAEEKARICFHTTWVAYGIAILFAAGGDLVLAFFGITVDSLRVAGGVVLFLLAIDMLRAGPSKKVTQEEIDEASSKDDISVFPLAMPLLTGPGAITTVIVLMGTAVTIPEKVIVILAISTTFAITYLILRSAEAIDKILGVTGIMVMTRIMGLILGSIAVNFVFLGAWNLYLQYSA